MERRVPRNSIRTVAPFYLQPLRWLAYVCVASYHRIAYRIRAWGGLPYRRGPTLLVANHQHEIESPVMVGEVGLRSFAWREPIFTVSSRRMWEPGFFAERVPWLRVAREANFGWLFGSLGMQPIENELQARPYASIAFTLIGLYGDLPVAGVFRERTREQLPPSIQTLSDLLSARHFSFARSHVRIAELVDPYKEAIMRTTREQLDADIAHFENLQRDGATIFLTPEGFYSGDGKMRPLRGILARLAPLATVMLAAVSYDPYDAQRLTLLYRITPARESIALDLQLKATRPVTTSALVCTYLADHPDACEADVLQAVQDQLAALPTAAFVVPELREQPAIAVRRVLGNLRRIGRKHPEFSRTDDMIAYQANFHAETLQGLAAT
jgi:hypothetical protein